MAEPAIVFRSYDPVEIELAEAQLRAAEIPHVRVGRGNAALLGVGNYILEQSIGVPLAFAEQARAALSGSLPLAGAEVIPLRPAGGVADPVVPAASGVALKRALLVGLCVVVAIALCALLFELS